MADDEENGPPELPASSPTPLEPIPGADELVRWRMLAEAAVRFVALALVALSLVPLTSWFVRSVVDGELSTWYAAEIAGAAVLIALGWALYQSAHRVAKLLIRAPVPDRCPGCGFDLTGLAGARCPECGIVYSGPKGAQQVRPSYERWHGAAVLLLRLLAAYFALWGLGAFGGWLAIGLVTPDQVFPRFSLRAGVALSAAHLLPPLLVWHWAPRLAAKALRGCAAWVDRSAGP